MKGGSEQKKAEIFLFRHGKTEANERQLYCGKTDLPLSKKGEEELLLKSGGGGAPLKGRALPTGVSIYTDISHCRIFTSGMKRSTQSLGIIYPKLALSAIKEEAFRELDFGDFEMKSYEELKDNPEYQKWLTGEAESFEREKARKKREETCLTQNWVDRIPLWLTEFNDNPCPHGESWLKMNERVLVTLNKLLEKDDSIAIFTHGGPISAIMAYFFPNEGKSLYEWQPDFGEGYKITLARSQKSITGALQPLKDECFLPEKKNSNDLAITASYEKIPTAGEVKA